MKPKKQKVKNNMLINENNSKAGYSLWVAHGDRFERTAIELWDICTQSNVDEFNAKINDEEWQKRVEKFKKRLARFQREARKEGAE